MRGDGGGQSRYLDLGRYWYPSSPGRDASRSFENTLYILDTVVWAIMLVALDNTSTGSDRTRLHRSRIQALVVLRHYIDQPGT